MSVIYFKSKKALNHLLNYGEVYTIRARKRRTGSAWVRHRRRKVADVWVELIAEIVDFAELDMFVDKSGFDSVEEWISEVKKLNRGKIPDRLFLYRVKVIGKKKV